MHLGAMLGRHMGKDRLTLQQALAMQALAHCSSEVQPKRNADEKAGLNQT